jgi:hypothetical protein
MRRRRNEIRHSLGADGIVERLKLSVDENIEFLKECPPLQDKKTAVSVGLGY